MSNFDFSQTFITFMKSMVPDIQTASGNSELVCHCRYCDDRNDSGHGHLYIKVPFTDKDPVLFHCFKCQISGIMDSKTLLDWGIYSPDIGITLDKIIKKASKKNKNVYSKEWFDITNKVSHLKLAQTKLQYLNSRLGTNLSIDDCLNEKIVLNLVDMLDGNKIRKLTRHASIISQFDTYFIGFLSLDNNFVNLRRICEPGRVNCTIDRRYINYNIHGKCDNTEKMYVIPGRIDISRPSSIHIAEGPFDILSIKHNLRKDEWDNSLFIAVTGCGYRELVRHLINSFRLFNTSIHLYMDNDKCGGENIVLAISDMIKPYGIISLYEHRNVFPGEKDFGVPLSNIKEQICQRV